MKQKTRVPPPAVNFYPPEFRDALVQAWIERDPVAVDLITDQLALRGYARPRNADANPSRKGGNELQQRQPQRAR